MTEGRTRKQRSSQDELDVKVFNFKLDRRKPGQAAARQRLETLMRDKSFSLRDQVIYWLTQSEKEIVFVDTDVSTAVENAMSDFREGLLQDIAALLQDSLMKIDPDMLRRMADEPDKKQEFSDTFVSGLMKGFNKRP